MMATHWSTILKMSFGFNHEDEQIEEAAGRITPRSVGV
jgi:hypothetical protein